jgi:hypothetical protein
MPARVRSCRSQRRQFIACSRGSARSFGPIHGRGGTEPAPVRLRPPDISERMSDAGRAARADRCHSARRIPWPVHNHVQGLRTILGDARQKALAVRSHFERKIPEVPRGIRNSSWGNDAWRKSARSFNRTDARPGVPQGCQVPASRHLSRAGHRAFRFRHPFPAN